MTSSCFLNAFIISVISGWSTQQLPGSSVLECGLLSRVNLTGLLLVEPLMAGNICRLDSRTNQVLRERASRLLPTGIGQASHLQPDWEENWAWHLSSLLPPHSVLHMIPSLTRCPWTSSRSPMFSSIPRVNHWSSRIGEGGHLCSIR